jgi:hypothetical protein
MPEAVIECDAVTTLSGVTVPVTPVQQASDSVNAFWNWNQHFK